MEVLSCAEAVNDNIPILRQYKDEFPSGYRMQARIVSATDYFTTLRDSKKFNVGDSIDWYFFLNADRNKFLASPVLVREYNIGFFDVL